METPETPTPDQPVVPETPAHVEPPKKKWPIYVYAGAGIVVIFLVFAVVKTMQDRKGDGGSNGKNDGQSKTTVSTLDTSNLPKIIQANFVDLAPITSISKFRSLAGHDFSNGGETCRSMKHYFNQNIDPNYKPASFEGHSIPAPPDGVMDIAIYSPVDGTISQITEEHLPVGKQFYIVPSNYKDYTIRLFHVFPSEGITAGQTVKAGQKIGVIAKGQGTDVSVEYGLDTNHDQFVSFFDVMPDSLFASYASKGLTSRDGLIISKAERDANSATCTQGGDQAFQLPAGYDEKGDYVYLSGYIEPPHGN